VAGIIDTRELVEELDDLETEDDDDLDDDDIARRDNLRELLDDVQGYAGDSVRDGVTLIPEDGFEDHARELAEDIGAIPDNASWPLTCIDWEAAARDLQTDYTSCELDGVTYYYR
jgi:hypothetical protein